MKNYAGFWVTRLSGGEACRHFDYLDAVYFFVAEEQGEFVKSPSIFLKKVQFVREYEILDGRAVPKHVESKINTRVWGTAEVSISYRNFVKADDATVTTNNE